MRHTYQFRRTSHKGVKHSPLHISNLIAKIRGVPSCVKGKDIWDLCSLSCQHSHWRNECMAPLTMNKVPVTTFDQRIHFWSKVVVTLCRPGSDTNNAHAINEFLFGK